MPSLIDWNPNIFVARLATVCETTKKVCAIGSGFVYRLDADKSILVTAAHCAHEFQGRVLQVAVHSLTTNNNIVFNLMNLICLVCEELDIALIILDHDRLDCRSFVNFCPPIDVEPINYIPVIGRDFYQIIGFPAAKNKIGVTESNNLHRFSISVPEVAHLEEKRAEQYWCRKLDLKNMYNEKFEPKRYPLKTLKGMSGGPLIRYYNDGSGVAWHVCGILTDWYKKDKVAVGVHWKSIMKFIEAYISGEQRAFQ